MLRFFFIISLFHCDRHGDILPDGGVLVTMQPITDHEETSYLTSDIINSLPDREHRLDVSGGFLLYEQKEDSSYSVAGLAPSPRNRARSGNFNVGNVGSPMNRAARSNSKYNNNVNRFIILDSKIGGCNASGCSERSKTFVTGCSQRKRGCR